MKNGKNETRGFRTTPIEEGESLEDYLGKLVCTGCAKQCSLLSPQCGTGRTQAQQATTYYETGEENSTLTCPKGTGQ
ncbi:hypothetical protein ACTQ6A_04655 [Lachnospiraceae bacterium LCP25S3_G4]